MRDRQAQSEKPERLRRFKHWFGKRNPRQANLWRFRRRIAPHMRVRPFEFPRTGALSAPFPAYREMVKRRFADVKLARSRLFYEHMIVGQAFGVAGDIDIASFQPTLEQIQNFNREAEEMERERIHHETRERRTRPAFRLR